MTTANLSEDGKQITFTTFQKLYCSPDLTTGIHGQLTFISVLNTFLSFTAVLGNTLILLALRKESSLHPPSKLLLSCLATADLCVGLTVEPLAVAFLWTIVNEQWKMCRCVYEVASTTGFISGAVSLWTLTAISVDRLFALLLGLRYRQVVTLKRTYLIIVTIWIVSAVSALKVKFFWNSPSWLWFGIIVVSLNLVISTFSYTKIFFTLRHRQNQVRDLVQHPNQTNELNIARYRKAVSTALWLQFTLVVCYLPYVIAVTLLAYTELSSTISLAITYTFTLVFLNSSLNPILYCWKIEEVGLAVKDTIRHVLSC